MPQMTIFVTHIFTTPDKFITVKRTILIIEFCLFTSEIIKGFIKLFLRGSSKQSIYDSIYLNHRISIWFFEHILSNVRNNTWHPTSHRIISIDMFLYLNPLRLYGQKYIVCISSIIIWWWLFFITFVIRHVLCIFWKWYVWE